MRRIWMGSALAALMLATACDAVKIPGVDRDDPNVEPPPAGENTAPDETETIAAPAPSPQPAPAPVTDEEPTGNGEDAPLPEGPADGDAAGDLADTAGPDASPLASLTSLAEINAQSCGLPDTAEPTLTVAQLTGADQAVEGPRAESAIVGTAAVGGIAARLTAFPGIVKMEPRTLRAGGSIASGHCGATRLSERWFVTAAHCVDDGYDEIRFVTGVENIRDEDNAKIVKAELSVCHGAYDGQRSTFANDIALLRLSQEDADLLTSVPVANIGITEKALTPVNYPTAEMAGWGLTGFTESLSPVLLSAPLNLVSAGPAQIVISSRGGSGPCVGDSGGPLYVTEADGRKVVVGVLSVVEQNSEGAFCTGDYRGRYTNLQGFGGWMDTVISACDSNEDLCR